MRATRLLVVLAVAVLGVGLFSATAFAGKKKKTSVIYFSGNPKFNNSGKVTVKGIAEHRQRLQGLPRDEAPGCSIRPGR